MMTATHAARAQFDTAFPDGLKRMVAASAVLGAETIDPVLRHLIDVRVSQINGCGFCLDMHTREARAAGESQQRLDVLAGWDETDLFTDAEKAALAWAEAITRVGEEGAPQHLYDALAAHFDELRVVAITMAIAMINAWNRMAVGLGLSPAPR